MFSHSPSPKLTSFLFLRICLSWTCRVRGITQYLVLCVWLFLLCMMFSRSVHVIVCISTSFLVCWSVVHVWMDHLLFIHLAADGHLCYSHFLAGMNHAAFFVFLCVVVFSLLLDIHPRNRLPGSHGNSLPNLWRNCWIVFRSGCPISIPLVSLFLILANTSYFLTF